ncbi:MAG: LysM peptidoglycan-binding domain-containing protein [Anaerolineaceae bacterium]|nr:LysM peptidoglycan-binding domain-containing protein [Anaerolineaceae bacterium]
MRKLFIFLLLIAGWGIIFYPMAAKPQAFHFPLGAHPAAGLPQPWKSGAGIQVLPRSGSAVAGESSVDETATCSAVYAVQKGESLGEIARRCVISLESLLSANPQIANPNRINAGQSITIPVLAGRGGGDDLSQPVILDASGYAPGAVIEIQVSGLPAGVPIRVGIGLSASGYRVIEQAVSGADGRLSLSLTIPSSARQGERGFVLVTTAGVPSVQVISPEFTIQ